jgi:hypothetical protein
MKFLFFKFPVSGFRFLLAFQLLSLSAFAGAELLKRDIASGTLINTGTITLGPSTTITSGSGTINANQLGGQPAAAFPTLGGSNNFTGPFSTSGTFNGSINGWLDVSGTGHSSNASFSIDKDGSHDQSVSIGDAANGSGGGTALGYLSQAQNLGVAIGNVSSGANGGVAIGTASQGTQSGVAIGDNASLPLYQDNSGNVAIGGNISGGGAKVQQDLGLTDTVILGRGDAYSQGLWYGVAGNTYQVMDGQGNYVYLPPSALSSPVISGEAIVGGTLACTTGLWNRFPAGYIYQWITSPDQSTWTNISGGTNSTYSPVSGDAGNFLECLVAGYNTSGTGTPAATGATSPIGLPPSNISGLVAYWSFDNASFSDWSGNGYDLVNWNNVTTAPGFIGNCASFDGADYLGFNGSIGGGGDFTISFWAQGGYSGVFLFSEGDGIELTNTTIWAINSTLSYFSGSGFTFPTDTAWHWVCVINNSGASTMTVYIDNVQVDSVTYTGSLFTSGNYFLWGYANDGYHTGGGTGLIDEAAVFNVQLTGDQMSQIYNDGLGDPFPF